MICYNGIMELSRLSDETVKSIHEYYLEVRSLNKTIKWLKEELDIGGINRHHLSNFFKRRNLEVYPPNGRHLNTCRPINQYYSPESELASAILKSAINDYGSSKSLIGHLSACAFFSGELYWTCLQLINSEGKFGLTRNTLPDGVNRIVVQKGNEIYQDQYNYWVSL